MLPEAARLKELGEQDHGARHLPFLTQDNDPTAAPDCRADVAIDERLGQAALDLAALALLALVDPEPVEAADPLRPPVQHQPAVQQRLLPRELRISDEEEMGLVPPLGQRP